MLVLVIMRLGQSFVPHSGTHSEKGGRDVDLCHTATHSYVNTNNFMHMLLMLLVMIVVEMVIGDE